MFNAAHAGHATTNLLASERDSTSAAAYRGLRLRKSMLKHFHNASVKVVEHAGCKQQNIVKFVLLEFLCYVAVMQPQKHLPENGWRRYRSFLPVTRSFFGTGGSDDRRVDASLVSVVLKWPLTCFCRASYM